MAGLTGSESEEEEEDRERLTYSEEQKQLRESFRVAAHLSDGGLTNGGTGEGEEDLLVLRQKTQEEKVAHLWSSCPLSSTLLNPV